MTYYLTSALLRRKVILLLLPGLFLLACGSGSTISPTSPPPTETGVVAAASQTPTPAQTVSTGSDMITQQTPDTPPPPDTPTTPPQPSFTPLPEPSTTPTPTATPPQLGVITGQITFLHHSGEIRPDTEAEIELVASAASAYFSAATNAEGRYTLADITPGQYWLMARSPIGSSNPQEVEVNAGETLTQDLRTFIGYPVVSVRPAGGRVLVDNQPVAGAKVWTFGGLVDSDKLALTDQDGYFSFAYMAGTPVIALAGDRWTVATLQPDAVIDLELDRTGPHPAPPDGPVVTPIPVNEDVVIVMPTVPVILATPQRPEIQIITSPTPPTLVQPAPTLVEIEPIAPIRPTLAPIPTACGQPEAKIDYGPIQVGSTVILDQHEIVDGTASWDQEMAKYIKQKATVTKLAGLDKVGCPVVQVDIDKGRWLWRIRAMSLLEP